MRANALGCTCEVELGRYVQHSHRSKLVKIGAVRRAGVGPDRSRARAWTKCRALGRRQQPQPRLQTLSLSLSLSLLLSHRKAARAREHAR